MQSNIDFRTSQSYLLGFGQTAAPAAGGTLNAQAARNLVLGRFNISPNLPVGQIDGTVTALSVQGASILCSNQPCALRGFHTALQMDENFIGVPLVQNGVASFTFAAQTVASLVSAAIYADPWNSLGEPPSPDESGPSSLNYAYGMGAQALGAPAGSTITLQATALRACVLGRLYIGAINNAAVPPNHDSEAGVIVTSIQINSTEQLGSAVGAGVPLSAFGLDALSSMANLNQFVPMNGTVSITIVNNSGVALGVSSHFFCNAS